MYLSKLNKNYEYKRYCVSLFAWF